MATQPNDETLAANRLLSDQLLQARADLHRLGVNDQNRALVYAAVTGALGIGIGLLIGLQAGKKPR